jgi:uncharacterized protein (TIGR04255 family)
MSTTSEFVLNLNEEFPSLTNSPVLEAVIHWEAQASKTLEQTLLKEELTNRLPDYPDIFPQYGIHVQVGSSDDITQLSQWNGFRINNASANYVAQFTHSGLAFSKVGSYKSWGDFTTEALRIWDIFVELAEPTTIHRLGVRFINQILLKQGVAISTYLKISPHRLSGLEISPKSFFYQDTYQVTDYPYQINLVRTIQPDQTGSGDEQLIIDIDVFTTEIANDQNNLTQLLSEMRWIKNKIFFSSITEVALNNFAS